MDQTPGSKDESQVVESQRLGEEVDVERRVQLLISFTTQVVFGYVAQVLDAAALVTNTADHTLACWIADCTGLSISGQCCTQASATTLSDAL